VRRSSSFPLLALLCALVPVLALGVYLGGHPRLLPYPVQALLVDEEVRTTEEALETIEDDYYRRVGRSRLLNEALAGAVRSLNDRFSAYLDPAAFRRFEDSSEGRYAGIGTEVNQDSRGLRVVRVFPGTPAARAGIRRGDLVVAADGRPLAGRAASYGTALIRGRPGTTVTLTVASGGSRRDIRVVRARVSVPVVESSLRTVERRRLALVSLSNFTTGAHGELRVAIDRRRRAGARGVLLDLRGNGGGLLDEAVRVASVFIPRGPVVIIDGRSRPRRVLRAGGGAIPQDLPVVVLVDRDTASAAEIVAGAIQDRGRGTIVGTRTFGKGVFQQVTKLPNGGGLDITVGQYFTPRGRNLGGGGVRPGTGIPPDVPLRNPAGEAGLRAALRTLASQVR
jgi:carboxyl-terminal processing protease